jgi:hypothetical protein
LIIYIQFRLERGAYAHFSFLSQDTLVFPNSIRNTLEVIKIVIESHDTLRLMFLCVLYLPPLSQRNSIFHLSCHTEPNPVGSGPLAIPAQYNRPFRDKAEAAIIQFHMLIGVTRTHVGDSPVTRQFTFIMHRRALLAHISAAHRACAPFCSMPESTHPVVQVPWSAWGPGSTRWFEWGNQSVPWMTTTAGQRTVTLEDRMPGSILLRDFNPYAVRAARSLAGASGQSQQGNWAKQLPNGNQMTLIVEDSVLTAGSIFEEDVRSSLPYVEIGTQRKYQYDGVLIDDERILGVKVRIESLISSPVYRLC